MQFSDKTDLRLEFILNSGEGNLKHRFKFYYICLNTDLRFIICLNTEYREGYAWAKIKGLLICLNRT